MHRGSADEPNRRIHVQGKIRVCLSVLVVFVASCGAGEADLEERQQPVEQEPSFEGIAAGWTCTPDGCESTMISAEVRQEFVPDAHLLGFSEPDLRASMTADEPWASRWVGDQVVHVVVELVDASETAFTKQWQDSLSAGDRVALIQSRKQSLTTLQRDSRTEIARLGGTVVGAFWSSNALDVRISAASLSTLRSHRDVVGIWPADVGGTDDYDMDVAWAKLQRDAYDDADIWGEMGSGSGDNIKLCFIEWWDSTDSVINSNHVAFKDWGRRESSNKKFVRAAAPVRRGRTPAAPTTSLGPRELPLVASSRDRTRSTRTNCCAINVAA